MDRPTIRLLTEWAYDFHAAATKDNFRQVVSWHEANGFECTPAEARRRIRETVDLVTLAVVHHSMNGWGPKTQRAFLKKQAYEPSKTWGRYLLSFSTQGSRWPAISVEELREVDLSDLYDGTGFPHLEITRADGKPMRRVEKASLKGQVSHDFEFDPRGPGEKVHLEFTGDGYGLHVMPQETTEQDKVKDERETP